MEKPRARAQTPSSVSSTWWFYVQLMRLHKFPLGTVFVTWPCGGSPFVRVVLDLRDPLLVWALTMLAFRERLPLSVFGFWTVVFVFASILIHAVACVLNDICDRDLDAQVG